MTPSEYIESRKVESGLVGVKKLPEFDLFKGQLLQGVPKKDASSFIEGAHNRMQELLHGNGSPAFSGILNEDTFGQIPSRFSLDEVAQKMIEFRVELALTAASIHINQKTIPVFASKINSEPHLCLDFAVKLPVFADERYPDGVAAFLNADGEVIGLLSGFIE